MHKLKTGVLLVLLAACTTAPQETARPSSTAAENTVTATHTITPSPMPEDTATPTATEGPPPVVEVCPAIASEIPEGMIVEGKIVLVPMDLKNPYLFEPKSGRIIFLPHTETPYFSENLVVSPSREFMAYFAQAGNPSQLVVSNGRGEIFYESLVDQQAEWYWIDSWINNQALMLDKPNSIPGIALATPLPTTIFNPFTGEIQDLDSNYPDIIHLDPLVYWDNSGFSATAYDPTLQLVAYAKKESDGRGLIALWDIEAEREIASIQAPIGYGSGPVWSPDGSRIVTVSLAKPPDDPSNWTEENRLSEELFSVSRTGEIERLTYLTDQFDEVEIYSPAWSPDGNQIAFWLRIGRDDGFGDGANYWRLAILNLLNKEVTRYCFPGGGVETRIFWSPDGNQLVVAKLNIEKTADSNRNIYDTVVIDLAEDDTIFTVAEETVPYGWMADTP